MRRIRRVAMTVAGLILVAVPAVATEPAARDVEYVVLVSIDGLSASYLNDSRAELPVLRGLAQRGAVAEGMQTSFPSVTWPSHVSLVTGTTPARHGVACWR